MTQEASSVHSNDALLAEIAQLHLKFAYLEERCRQLVGMVGKTVRTAVNTHRLMVTRSPIKMMTPNMMALSGKILTHLTNPQPLKLSGSLQINAYSGKPEAENLRLLQE